MRCTFCKHIFSNKQNLNAHQKTAKYCLKIQGKEPDYKFSCKDCNKTFRTKKDLKRHEDICSPKYLLKKLKEENSKLKLCNSNKDMQLVEKDRYFEILRNDYKELVDKYVTNAQERVKLFM
jgi:hypothetical protein